MSLHFAALSYNVETYGCWQGASPKGQNEGIQSISTRRQKSFCVLERLAEPITSRTWETVRDCDTRTISNRHLAPERAYGTARKWYAGCTARLYARQDGEDHVSRKNH